MPKVLVVANWKMNPATQDEAKRLFRAIHKGIRREGNAEVILCLPFVYLGFKFQVSSFKFGAQDCFWKEKGAYTGEISPLMLRNLGCEYVIIGHSERRRYLGETDAMINQKLKAVLASKMKPILCIGETKEERDKGLTHKLVRSQLMAGLKGIQKSDLKKIIIAYEPVWAIGTGDACSFEEAAGALRFIRRILKTIAGTKSAQAIPILYGGSVDSLNAAGYVKEAQFQGLLVGGASLDAKEFVKIIDVVR